MYNDEVLIQKLEVIDPINDSIIILNCLRSNKYIIIFTSDKIISNFGAFTNHKLDIFYLTEIMIA